jgi:thiosulfate/3-mercaptopyruvate sulfurtransferase
MQVTPTHTDPTQIRLTQPDWLVTTDSLAGQMEDPELRIYDTTVLMDAGSVESGRAGYDEAHVPGAGFLDLLGALSDPESDIPFTRPSPERLASELAGAGIGEGHRVVLYSRTHVMWATRVFWLLRGIGFDRASVLDGGFALWRARGQSICGEPCRYPAADLEARPRPEVWADREEVLKTIGDGAVCTINALPAALHRAESEHHYGRPGRIAGSVNVPFTRIVDPETGCTRPPDQWRAAFDAVGSFDRSRVVTYCGGGISATVDAFALAALGHPDVAVYDGSLFEWTRDPSLPMETGD